jgi:hypothetical protein
MPPKPTRPAPVVAGHGPLETDQLAGAISSEHKSSQRLGQLIDRYGHPLSENVLHDWSPAARRALGVHRIGDEPEDGTP